MTHHSLAVSFVAVFLAGALVLRPALHRLRTGSWGVHGVSGSWRTPGFWGGLSFIASMLLTPVALVLPAEPSPSPALAIVLIGAGAVFTFLSQANMGSSWRIGVAKNDRTELVTTGVFATVRNPIFTGMVSFAVGLSLWWPNVVSVAATALLVLAVELQVRFVEEPWLREVHGRVWAEWARRVGRFVPWLGRVSA